MHTQESVKTTYGQTPLQTGWKEKDHVFDEKKKSIRQDKESDWCETPNNELQTP